MSKKLATWFMNDPMQNTIFSVIQKLTNNVRPDQVSIVKVVASI